MLSRLLLDPTTESAGNGPAAPVPAQASLPLQAAPPPAPSPAPSPAAPEGVPAPAPEEHWTSIREAAQQFGVSFGEDVPDDEAALRRLADAYRSSQQNDYFTRLGQHVAGNPQLLAAAQGQPSAAQPQVQRDPVAESLASRFGYNPPEYRPEWLNMVTRDPESGRIVALPGQDPTIAARLETYAAWRENWRNNLDRDFPAVVQAAIGPILQQHTQQVLGLIEQQQAQLLLQQHASELYTTAPDGRRQLTDLGQRVSQHIALAQQYGVAGQQQQLDFALRLARAEMGSGASPPPPPPAPAPQRPVPPGALRTAPVGGQQVSNRIGLGRTQAPAPPPSSAGLSFEQMLRQELSANGVT